MPPHEKQQMSETLAAFHVAGEDNILEGRHLFSKSNTVSVGCSLETFAITRIVAPPLFAKPFMAMFLLNDQPMGVTRYDWFPSEMHFYGKPAGPVNAFLQVIPLADRKAVLARIHLHNDSDIAQKLSVAWSVQGRFGSISEWSYNPDVALDPVIGDPRILSDESSFTLSQDDCICVVYPEGPDITIDGAHCKAAVTLAPQQEIQFGLIVVLGKTGSPVKETAESIAGRSDNEVPRTRNLWDRWFTETAERVPTLQGASPALESFYHRGILTWLTCRWEAEELVFSPWYATSGLDGGALNCYLWDIAYMSKLVTLLDPAAVRRFLLAFAHADMSHGFALDPLTGNAMGPLYAYNYYSMARLTRNYIAYSGDLTILDENIKGRSYLEFVYRYCLQTEDMESAPDLVDFGDNSNLLELRTTDSYTHYTPSPNAERILIYRHLAEIYEWANQTLPYDLITRGQALAKVFCEAFWDDQEKWLVTLDSDRRPRLSYSIQIFDALRCGFLPAEQARGIVSHLREGEFLSQWGLYSLAVNDPGYDANDVDWGGPGAYAGEAPELIEDLLQAGFTDEGVDLLKRILWWAEMPYYPQAIRADRKGYREDGRPNVAAGTTASQCIINGLFGVDVDDRWLLIRPINHPYIHGMALRGLRMRGISVDVAIDPNGDGFEVVQGQQSTRQALGESVRLALPALV
jgi:hypothetical protein